MQEFTLNPIYTDKNFEQISDLPEFPKDKKIFLLTDDNVFGHYGSLFSAFEKIVLPSGEESKSFRQVEEIITELLEKGADRSSFLLGVGGGVICDITGFTASIFMRGISFAFVPTTLLAQTDASIGGKNGVNIGMFKNMAGVFTLPDFILADVKFLKTLPDADFADGLAEVVKHACIRSRDYFEFLEQNADKILARDEKILLELIAESVKIKAEIVRKDPFEKGERKLLNFGHTVGHALEKFLNISHGKAVSIGINVVNNIAVQRKILPQNEADSVRDLLKKFGLPVELNAQIQDLLPIIKHDKKVSKGVLSLILLRKIGHAEVFEVPISDLIQLSD
jgi:3-dehydroquinate synthase